jgi:acyl carrier protein
MSLTNKPNNPILLAPGRKIAFHVIRFCFFPGIAMGHDKGGLPATPYSEGEILLFLKEIALEELELKPEQIEHLDMDTAIVEGLQLDSVMQVVLITQIEEHFGFVFDLEDNDKLETVGDLVEMIQERGKRKGTS